MKKKRVGKSDYRKFLEELECKDEEESKNSNFSDRIGSLRTPVFHVIDKHPPWSQISFSGTALFSLHPISQGSFEKYYGISNHDIPDLIKFVKTTHKVIFLLSAPPTAYEKYDYLEPIIREFQPPVFHDYLNYPGWNELLLENYETIDMIGRISKIWRNLFSLVEPDMKMYTASRCCALRYFGFDNIADTFVNSMWEEDPEFSYDYLNAANSFLLFPFMNPLTINSSFSLDEIERAKKWKIPTQFDLKEFSFPEVGSYLMNKCTYYPESMEACKNLIEHYKDEDLYKVYSALNNAIHEKQDTVTLNRTGEIGEILENIWNDPKIRQDTSMYSYGIDIACGTIGFFLGGGVPGLLGSLGLSVIDDKKSKYIETYSELIAKNIASPCLATVYDFKKKYKIDF